MLPPGAGAVAGFGRLVPSEKEEQQWAGSSWPVTAQAQVVHPVWSDAEWAEWPEWGGGWGNSWNYVTWGTPGGMPAPFPVQPDEGQEAAWTEGGWTVGATDQDVLNQ
jgi:hypothetical protein